MTGVSVVIPCYRCAATIGRAVRSALEQTQAPAEIILVDDASGDGTRDALEALRREHRTVRVVDLPENRGPGSARNAGWNVARGEWIAFLDADDAWHPRKIEIQLGWMLTHEDASITSHRIGRATAVPEPALPKAVRVSAAMMLASNRFHTSSVMLRSGIARRFADGKRYCEDYHLWLEIVLRGGVGYYLDASLAMRFKPAYGAGGASGQLWAMHRGELDAFRRVWRAGLLGLPGFAAASAWSSLKFLRRMAMGPPG